MRGCSAELALRTTDDRDSRTKERSVPAAVRVRLQAGHGYGSDPELPRSVCVRHGTGTMAQISDEQEVHRYLPTHRDVNTTDPGLPKKWNRLGALVRRERDVSDVSFATA